MNFASIIFNLIFFLQGGPCGGCASGGSPCAPCCEPIFTCGGPPPPPGLPIDNFVCLLFFVALIFGTHVILKLNKNKLAG